MRMSFFNSRILFNLAVSVLLLSLFYYLVFHTMNGDRGITALFKLSTKFQDLQNELDVTRDQRLTLESRVKALRSDSLDLDLLDEQARKIIGLSQPSEVVYMIEHEMDE